MYIIMWLGVKSVFFLNENEPNEKVKSLKSL